MHKLQLSAGQGNYFLYDTDTYTINDLIGVSILGKFSDGDIFLKHYECNSYLSIRTATAKPNSITATILHRLQLQYHPELFV